MIQRGAIVRAARLFIQLPKKSRFNIKKEPLAQWDWSDIYLMEINQSLRMLAWFKTKDAQSKTPKNQPKLEAPDFIHKAIAEAEKKKKKGKRSHTPDARTFSSTEELDAYLRKPRKSVSKMV